MGYTHLMISIYACCMMGSVQVLYRLFAAPMHNKSMSVQRANRLDVRLSKKMCVVFLQPRPLCADRCATKNSFALGVLLFTITSHAV